MNSTRIGDLLVHVWPAEAADAPVVVAAHGITANGLSWAQVARGLDRRVTLVAPDLRGRAGSRDAPGPYGIGRHADDLIALLDRLDTDRAVLTGHSMGAFVAAVAASRHPERVDGVVLVDGGVAFPAPAGTDLDAVLAAVLGPAMARLSMTFPDREAYRQFWQAHPAFAGAWSPAVEAYVEHDLIGDGPFRSSCVAEAVRTDGGEVIVDDETLTAVHTLRVPAVLLYAERGLMNEPQALYDPQRLAGLEIPAVLVPDTNHYSIVIGAEGAATVADHILRAAAVPL
ncbi:alpha/beta hydrolase [Planosporangium thailandense]|uniref:Alpha/beta hydrolase n=1 Tax=Planosporangium thailandense TaxID=765197 RepID=A0ABX0Y2K8_9ACTN|nr:alpha/beta fold hydrolase [Planosporangium thailandense]NJC72599.1 alpha/beta hydrolase [Planosporangium thailandense]